MGDQLSADDARILSLESESLLGHTLKLIVVEPGAPLSVDQLRRSVAERLPRVPRAQERIDTTSGPPRWVRADTVDLDYHVRARAGECADDDQVRLLVSELMSEHLDRSHPLWTFDVIGPLPDGRQAIAARIHHAMADGIAAVRFLEAVLLDPHDAPVHESGMRPARPASAAAAHPLTPLDEVRRLPAVVARELGHPGGRSPFDRPVTSARELAFCALPLAGMRAIGASRPSHATVNDVLLASVAGGLATWPTTTASGVGRTPGRLRAQVPVSLHHRAEEGGSLGNHDSFLDVDLPLGPMHPAERLDAISAQTRTAKQSDDAAVLYDLMHALGRLGSVGATTADLLTGSAREFAVAVSNVPGPRVAVSVAGRRVTQLYSSSEPGAHHALRIAAISDADTLGIGFSTDPTALPGIADLATATLAAFTRLQSATLSP
ncbi:WS/DGAT domain-containing protein [Herbiconiux moechotypicola]|uniref:diacylglycerol O-acyltransferase n=1 Tax=Herbiconiux moechotypicola TaxID=637393 RepID=A0ABN3DLD4_9MICO|nr:wax ester/triacylglycerol synthase domain-containing protein [Herbiconiux moechotypicola]MCS5730150.1 WS/DGAT domain-containing protein [Herbiconiux moechotypicola]